MVTMAASPCRIAAKRLTLTGGADRVGGRLPAPAGSLPSGLRSQAVPIVWASGCLGTSWSASTCRITASLRSQAGPIVWAAGCRIAAERLLLAAAAIVWLECRIAAATPTSPTSRRRTLCGHKRHFRP